MKNSIFHRTVDQKRAFTKHLYRLIAALAYSEQVGSEWQADKKSRDLIAITGKQSQAPPANASPHGYEAAVGAEAPTAMPLSRWQRVAQSNPAWGRPQGPVQGAIDPAVAVSVPETGALPYSG
jgi:hypothetical protein